MKIYLMRHGETKWNKRSKLQGQVDIPLAPKGIEQAEMTSEGMKDIPFDHIFSTNPFCEQTFKSDNVSNHFCFTLLTGCLLKKFLFSSGISTSTVVS